MKKNNTFLHVQLLIRVITKGAVKILHSYFRKASESIMVIKGLHKAKIKTDAYWRSQKEGR
jgi:hypothetical protein